MSNVTLRAQHPDYVGSSNNFAADVAVLTLDRAVTLNQYVAIATLAPAGSNWEGKETWISGWGKVCELLFLLSFLPAFGLILTMLIY